MQVEDAEYQFLKIFYWKNKYNLHQIWYAKQYVFSNIKQKKGRGLKWTCKYIIIYLLYAITLILACEFWVGVPLSWWMMHQNSCLAQLCNHHQNLSIFSLHPHLLFVRSMVHLNMEDPLKKAQKFNPFFFSPIHTMQIYTNVFSLKINMLAAS